MSLKQSWIYFLNCLEKCWIALNVKCPGVYGPCLGKGAWITCPTIAFHNDIDLHDMWPWFHEHCAAVLWNTFSNLYIFLHHYAQTAFGFSCSCLVNVNFYILVFIYFALMVLHGIGGGLVFVVCHREHKLLQWLHLPSITRSEAQWYRCECQNWA